MKYLPPILFTVTALSLGALRFCGVAHASPAPEATTLPPVALASSLIAGGALLDKAISNLPAWEADKLAPFERPQLDAIRNDIDACESDADPEAFLDDIQRLKDDSGALVAVDDALATWWMPI